MIDMYFILLSAWALVGLIAIVVAIVVMAGGRHD